MSRKSFDAIGLALLEALPVGIATPEVWQVTVNGVPDTPMPVKLFFRGLRNMKKYERLALALCEGHVLDLGAGAGAHALVLQKRSLKVTAMERSKGACEVMLGRGVHKVVHGEWPTDAPGKFDTVLALMNGTGLAGTAARFPEFLRAIRKKLNPGGQVLIDSTDISYFYDEHPDFTGETNGEVMYQMEYKGAKGEVFPWLYLTKEEMKKAASKCGFAMKVVVDSDDTHYLARLVRLNGNP